MHLRLYTRAMNILSLTCICVDQLTSCFALGALGLHPVFSL